MSQRKSEIFLKRFRDSLADSHRSLAILARESFLRTAVRFEYGVKEFYEIAEEIIEDLHPEDYHQGPLSNKTEGFDSEVWVFKKVHRGVELYIKLTFNGPNPVCISFHD